MIILIGKSASGKTEIAKELIKEHVFKKVITTTTRKQRIGEQDKIDYYFISENEFKAKIQSNQFIECSKYANNYYGITKDAIISDGVVILDPSGVNALLDFLDFNAFVCFVETPRFVRKHRMKKRGDDNKSIQSRIQSDDLIFNKLFLNQVNLSLKNFGLFSIKSLTNKLIKKYKSWQNKIK